MNIPQGNSKEDLKQREEIKTFRRKGVILHYRHFGIKKEIDRLAHKEGHRQIMDV